MVLGYDYNKQKRRWGQTNAPHLPAVSMAMAVRRSNTNGIAQFGMSMATPEATGGCRHRATTSSVLPWQPPGQQAYKPQSTNTPAKLAILMAMAMCLYVTACVAQWRRSRVSLEAAGHRHQASNLPNNIVQTWLRHFFTMFSSSKQ
jgi:hypothetical protein